MEGLFPCRAFIDFGPNSLGFGNEPALLESVTASRSATLRARLRERCPRRPGVYGMLTDKQELVYIGKAKSLRARLLSYFRPRSRDPKAGRIIKHISTIVWEHAPSEFAALLRELGLIRRWRPRFNVQGQPGRRQPVYVCLGRPPAPQAFLARFPPAGVLASFGPVRAGWRVREAVRRVNDWFKLRDCPGPQEMVFADQQELFPIDRAAGCLRYEIGTCLGPCLGVCARPDYMAQVRAAQRFLSGKDHSPLQALEQQMTAAAAALAFERAAAVRDKLDSLRWLSERLGDLRRARDRQSFVYPVQGYDGEDTWYLVRAGRVLAALRAPKDAAELRLCKGVIRKTYQERMVSAETATVDEIDSVLLVAAWFRRHPQEQDRVLLPDEALAMSWPGCTATSCSVRAGSPLHHRSA
jgi:excinuclease ABC subunit C